MVKEKKVRTRNTRKYTFSSDEESSNDEVDYNDLFKGLDRSKVEKINELIDALHEKDRLLENKKIFFMRNMTNLLMFKNLLLYILRKMNYYLLSYLLVILKLNNDVANLNAQLKTCKNDFEKLKFARDAYTIGRHPSIKDGLGFQKGTKN
jgi:hypothetical protein